MPESAAERSARSHTRRILQENVRQGTTLEETWGWFPSLLGIFLHKLWWRKAREVLAYRNQFHSLISVSSADVPRMLKKQ
jgi:hypothetical protein